MDRKNKIEPIYIDDKMLEDPKMDEFLRKSIIEEADRIEKELNTDPSLQGVGASDDMFEMIKARLQEQGVWEEEDEEAKQNNAYEKKISAHQKDSELDLDTDVQKQDDEKLDEEDEEEEKIRAEKTIKEVQIEEVKIKELGTEERENTVSKTQKEDIYSFLSKEDQDALTLGKKIKKKRKKRWKQLVAAAAAVVVVFTAGMSGEASRRWILDTWNKITDMTGFSVRTDYVDDDTKRISDTSMFSEEEKNAWNEIKEELTVPIVCFSYLPQGMEFSNYEILKDTNEARLFYSYEDSIFTVKVLVGNTAASFYVQSDVEPLLRETITNDQEIAIEIWDTTTGGMESYKADFEYLDCTFICNGVIGFDELKKMMKYMEIIY